MGFNQFPSAHDPNAGLSGPWTFRILLDAGETITGATVDVVDLKDEPIIGTDLIVSGVSVGLISGNTYGVSFYLLDGSLQIYNLRCRYITSNSPVTTYDATMLLKCAQT